MKEDSAKIIRQFMGRGAFPGARTRIGRPFPHLGVHGIHTRVKDRLPPDRMGRGADDDQEHLADLLDAMGSMKIRWRTEVDGETRLG